MGKAVISDFTLAKTKYEKKAKKQLEAGLTGLWQREVWNRRQELGWFQRAIPPWGIADLRILLLSQT